MLSEGGRERAKKKKVRKESYRCIKPTRKEKKVEVQRRTKSERATSTTVEKT